MVFRILFWQKKYQISFRANLRVLYGVARDSSMVILLQVNQIIHLQALWLVIFFCFFVFFCLFDFEGSTPSIAQKFILALSLGIAVGRLVGSYGISRIDPQLAVCKTSALHASTQAPVLFILPFFFSFLFCSFVLLCFYCGAITSSYDGLLPLNFGINSGGPWGFINVCRNWNPVCEASNFLVLSQYILHIYFGIFS